MALNEKLTKKIADKTIGNQQAQETIISLLKGTDEGKQLKRIIEPILKTEKHDTKKEIVDEEPLAAGAAARCEGCEC